MTGLEEALKRNVRAISAKCGGEEEKSCHAMRTSALIVGVAVAAGVIWMWPEIRRYLRMERM
jgi:hypothetical protein